MPLPATGSQHWWCSAAAERPNQGIGLAELGLSADGSWLDGEPHAAGLAGGGVVYGGSLGFADRRSALRLAGDIEAHGAHMTWEDANGLRGGQVAVPAPPTVAAQFSSGGAQRVRQLQLR